MKTDACDWMLRFKVVEGDLTKQKVDAIVNAANESLLGGGGVDGAIHRAAGPDLLAECRKLGGCPTGQAKVTRGYRLPAKHVIHTVGPIWYGGDRGEDDLLAQCYRNSLNLVGSLRLRSVAFPAISCGVFGFPIDRAAVIAVREIRLYLEQNADVERALVVCFGGGVYEAYAEVLQGMVPGE
jgi:O-acetyl-ADP-ribose deacetylase